MILTECLLADDSGSIKIIWFNQPFIKKQIKTGDRIYISGKVNDDYLTLQFTNPLWEKVSVTPVPQTLVHTGRIVPIYPLTENLTQKQLRFLIKQITPLFKQISEYLPSEVLKKYQLLPLPQALQQIHWPKNEKDYIQAKNRLQFDELFLLQLLQEKNRQKLMDQQSPAISFQEKDTQKLVNSLPFTLTPDQKKAAWEILQDISRRQPMNRLLQGDVGSGKTIVAAIACLNVSLQKKQAALLAPTEILARQHYDTFIKILDKFNLNLALFTRSQRFINNKSVTKKELKEKITSGKINIIIGTHALLAEEIFFSDLALIIIDEQHRFGVEQRARLQKKTKKEVPHFLSMTATPIPRTLALSLYGDLDISLIKNKPPGRKDVITKIVQEENRNQAYQFIKNKISRGQQAFVICPLIEESDKLGIKSATAEYEKLSKNVFPDLKIGLLHGRQKAADKSTVMSDFKNHQLDILVATAVVEVGVDVPRATLMIIEGAERFGLAQLHQFRGRVGRSDEQSYCFLFTDNHSPAIIKRLQAMVEFNNGLKLAEYDLKLRGGGEIYGTRQSGLPDLKIADLTDLDLVKKTRQAAKEIVQSSPDLKDFPGLYIKMQEFRENIHWE